MPDPIPTDLDLARLCVFTTLHGGRLPDVPKGVVATYRHLETAKLVTLTEVDYQIPTGCDVHNCVRLEATITPEGQAVVGAMLGAARKALGQ